MNKNNETIVASNYSIEIGDLSTSSLNEWLSVHYAHSKKVIFVDENTHDACLEYLITYYEALSDAEVIVLPAGEEHKRIEICSQVWEAMLEYQITRTDLAICLGGGVVTDMGGFISSLYKRGIDFIHIPTSLLAMIDASVGGKTGVDLGTTKNAVGVFSFPKAVYVDRHFLQTLPVVDQIGGWFEMLKHGLIANVNHWQQLKNVDFHSFDLSNSLISDSIRIKNEIVLLDPFEKNERKKLNFGHTIGHAVESFFLDQGAPINHGIAVGMGMIMESFISFEKNLIDKEIFAEITETITLKIGLPSLEGVTIEHLGIYLLNDKKNAVKDEIRAVLLQSIGTAVVDQIITLTDIETALRVYQTLIFED